MMEVKNKPLADAELYIADFFANNIGEKYVYHDFLHTKYVVDAALQIAEGYHLTEEELEILQLAAWFHDTGYDQGPEGHEIRSCRHLDHFLENYDFPRASLEKIYACIIATHFPHHPDSLLEKIVCDADMSHLGTEWYWDRCGKIRQELLLIKGVVMSEREWVDFELEFMTTHKYHTEIARQLFNKRKKKHVRQLMKHKLRLTPSPERDGQEKQKKSRRKKEPLLSEREDLQLKQLNLGRGVETMYRTTYRTHINLSSIADNKANIMLSINAIIISIIVANLVPQFELNPRLIIPTVILLGVCLSALVFAILSTRPKVTEGKFTREDIENKRSNLLFFGNFYNMDLEDFHWGMKEMITDSDFLYSSMTRDLYYLGVVLAKKYRYLNICYGIFMYGIIVSVIVFAIAFMYW